MFRRHWWVSVVVYGMACAFGVRAAKADDLQVNTYTSSDQAHASVARNAAGDFVVVWHSAGSGGSDTSALSIQGRRFAADGSTLGGEFQVNTYTTNNQLYPAVALGANGSFVVVWHSRGSSGDDTSIYSVHAQRYASGGSAAGGELQVNTYTTSIQAGARVGAGAGGEFVVVWQSDGSSGTDTQSSSIQGQRYASDGSPLAGEFQVNTYTTLWQFSPSMALGAAGDFVVVWSSNGSAGTDTSGYSVQGQRFGSDGSPVGTEFQVNTVTTNHQSRASVAAGAAGGFVVAWQSNAAGGTDYEIRGQRFASDGSPLGGELQVNTYATASQDYPSVAASAAGDIVVVWDSDGSPGGDSSFRSIQARRYASGGGPLGDQFQVNTYTFSAQLAPEAVLGDAGDVLVVWHSDGSGGDDNSGASVQRTPTALIFADGFESGDTSAW